MNILDRIIEHKRVEITERKQLIPVPGGDAFERVDVRPFDHALRQPGGIRVIAEFKKASPSKGIIRGDADPVEVADRYETHGAAAISVLTDGHFFQGHPDYLTAIRTKVGVPVLRKDFIIEDYQIREAAVMGADAILLIVSVLTDTELNALQSTAQSYGLQCLVEVHDEKELDRALEVRAHVIGINNRDLTNFNVDLQTSLSLKSAIPEEIITVSESGIHTREDVLTLQEAGFDAILVGESLMRSEDIGAKLDELLGH
jgi:indole-3-glycerol phosphate synthase